jgi:hypothetical protein
MLDSTSCCYASLPFAEKSTHIVLHILSRRLARHEWEGKKQDGGEAGMESLGPDKGLDCEFWAYKGCSDDNSANAKLGWPETGDLEGW